MSICQACGGVIGRDCFNPQECMDITRDMADRYSVAESEAMEKDYQVHVLGQYIDHLRDRIEVMHELFADIRKAVGGNSNASETKPYNYTLPWLPHSLMLRIDAAMDQEHRG